MKTQLFTRALLAGACGFALMTPAFAQSADETVEEGEIIVTAQNRAQSVQDVPIAMEVVSAEALADAGFGSANDLSKIAPAVQVNQDQGTVKVTIRGIGTASNDEAQDTSVVANIDGEYINRGNVLGSALFDLERVEVLRGPQGTLYGRNSTGGAINFITRKPGKDFGVDGSVSYGNYNSIRADAGIDLPLGADFGVRVAGFYEERDGYVSHPARAAFGPFPAFAGGRSDDNEGFGGRVSLAYDPGSGLSVNLAAEYSEREFTPQVFAAANLNAAGNAPTGPGCNRAGYERVAPNYAQTLCVPSGTNFLSTLDRSRYDAPNYGLGRIGSDTWAVRGRIAYEFSPEATLSYIGGYRNYAGGDFEFVTLPITYRSYSYQDDVKTQSHELRLNGDVNGIIYQVGAFYFDESQASESGFVIPPGGGAFLSYFGRYVDSKSWSGFGQVEVPLSETITAIGGLRYTDNKRDAFYRNASAFGPGAPDPHLFGAGFTRRNFSQMLYLRDLNLGSADSKTTWLLGLNYEPNADTLIFAKVSTGFKGGGFDSVGTYDPETNTAYEVGAKLTFGDDRQHTLNLGGYYYDYKGLQVATLLDTAVGGQTFNAGAATIWGLEADARFGLSRNTTFDVSVNYLNSQYDELSAQFNVYTVPGTGADVNGVGDLDPTTPGVQKPNFAGNTAPFSPKWVIALSLEHVIELGSAGSLTATAGTTFKSDYFADFYNYNDGKQKAYSQSDISLKWAPESEKFSVTAFVRNLEDTRPLTYGSFVSAGPDDIFNWQFGSPRTYGLRVGFNF